MWTLVHIVSEIFLYLIYFGFVVVISAKQRCSINLKIPLMWFDRVMINIIVGDWSYHCKFDFDHTSWKFSRMYDTKSTNVIFWEVNLHWFLSSLSVNEFMYLLIYCLWYLICKDTYDVLSRPLSGKTAVNSKVITWLILIKLVFF